MSTDPGTAPSRPTLQTFSLDDLAVYTAEGVFGPTASPDFRVFYVGRDDVHGVLMHLFTRVTLSVKMNMYGYDDDELNNSSTGQISHTKGGVLDGIVAFEGSTNWSSSGEGTGISPTAAKQAPGFKAQNNTLAVYTNLYEIAKFAARLGYEHAVAAPQPQPQPQPQPSAATPAGS
jgi:hypothetical protein